jgi:hypothetical protein
MLWVSYSGVISQLLFVIAGVVIGGSMVEREGKITFIFLCRPTYLVSRVQAYLVLVSKLPRNRRGGGLSLAFPPLLFLFPALSYIPSSSSSISTLACCFQVVVRVGQVSVAVATSYMKCLMKMKNLFN